MSQRIALKIKATSPEDRRDLFTRICELRNLDAAKTAEKYKLKTTSAGLNINFDSLMNFIYKEAKHDFIVEYKSVEKTLIVKLHELPSTGKVAVENPETIGNTTVDETPVIAVTESIPPIIEEEDDDDTPF